MTSTQLSGSVFDVEDERRAEHALEEVFVRLHSPQLQLTVRAGIQRAQNAVRARQSRQANSPHQGEMASIEALGNAQNCGENGYESLVLLGESLKVLVAPLRHCLTMVIGNVRDDGDLGVVESKEV